VVCISSPSQENFITPENLENEISCYLVAKILTEMLENLLIPMRCLGDMSFSCEGDNIFLVQITHSCIVIAHVVE
jgi:hypothetical protein